MLPCETLKRPLYFCCVFVTRIRVTKEETFEAFEASVFISESSVFISLSSVPSGSICCRGDSAFPFGVGAVDGLVEAPLSEPSLGGGVFLPMAAAMASICIVSLGVTCVPLTLGAGPRTGTHAAACSMGDDGQPAARGAPVGAMACCTFNRIVSAEPPPCLFIHDGSSSKFELAARCRMSERNVSSACNAPSMSNDTGWLS
mmetsp:Transcript_98886/g.285397  ORF Transcript_98886/g.285397 Transcript_98886/m.285397 type:complete len:201 (-) Transcript_98886:334-936(-)